MMTIDKAAAERLARSKVEEIGKESSIELAVMADFTIETPKGWVFFWNAAKYIRSGYDEKFLAFGGGPVFVKKNGCIVMLPGYKNWQDAISDLSFD